MINAQQARKESTDNFYKSLSATEKVAHFYIEGQIKLAVDSGKMYTEFRYDNPDVPDDVFAFLESQHYVNFLDELGYEMKYNKLSGQYMIVW